MQAHQGAILIGQRRFVQVVRQVDEHLPFRLRVAAKAVQTRQVAEQIPSQLQIPGRQKRGVGYDVLPDARIDFVPNLGKQQCIFRVLGNFFDIFSCQSYHQGYYTTQSAQCKEVFACFLGHIPL